MESSFIRKRVLMNGALDDTGGGEEPLVGWTGGVTPDLP